VSGPIPGRPRSLTGILAGLTLLLALGIGVSLYRKSRGALPVLGTVPAFSLTGAGGQAVTLDALRGRPWVADFIFTRCTGTCPVMTGKMAELQKAAPSGTRLVSFTVDPANDTPDVLARYGRSVGARADWLFLTGTKEALYALSTQGFKLAAMEIPPGQPPGAGDGPFLHSSRLVLVDRAARIRGYYDSEEAGTIERLLADLRRVSREGP
jgi:protein SCO1/2